ncbi:hypothetical protein O6H91_08G118600 [Diphasiastrum complanatum]|uniref:Uncharacterized protein n=1 Tax=Diphasiastrum complanatum TaxID=34168 RepID=A0ACC2D1K2_DIPCM|nr:hypothetical protein O6H91_08G118600 [Diphasiastrum complanatum]
MVNWMVNHRQFFVEFRELLGDGAHIFCNTALWLLELYICYLINEKSIISAYSRRFRLLLNVDLLLSNSRYVSRNGSTISASAFEATLDSLMYSQIMVLDFYDVLQLVENIYSDYLKCLITKKCYLILSMAMVVR